MGIMLKLEELESELELVKSPVLEFFLNGLSKKAILSFFEKEQLVPTEDLIEMYQWRNGVRFKDIPAGKLCFGVSGVFFPVEISMKVYNDNKTDFVNYFPIFSDDSYLLNLDPMSKDAGKISIYCPSLQIMEPQSYFDSMTSMIETFIACFRRGCFFYDKNGYFEQDYSLSFELAKEINPNSEYWKSETTK